MNVHTEFAGANAWRLVCDKPRQALGPSDERFSSLKHFVRVRLVRKWQAHNDGKQVAFVFGELLYNKAYPIELMQREDRMHFQYVVAPPNMVPPLPTPTDVPDATGELLRELIDVQREQLAYLRANHEAQHSNARWQAFLARWKNDYPTVGADCLKALPLLERAFLRLLDDLTQRVNDADAESIEDDFTLSEFLDRFGMRVSQLGAMLNTLGPIADAARTAPE